VPARRSPGGAATAARRPGPGALPAAAGSPGGGFAAPALAGLALAVAALAALHAARGLDYWNYSEGVYALTARLLAEGRDVYGDVVAAQPPWQFLAGAGLLSLEDSLPFLRAALGLVQVATGVLGAAAVWRLTASRAATAAAVPLALLTPWAVHEHGTLTPELLVAPLLLGAVLLGTSPRWSPLAGVLVALTPFVKLPFVLAVPVVVALSARPHRTAAWAAGALVAQAAVFLAVFGGGRWEDTVVAQLSSGRRGPRLIGEIWAQAAWNLAGLLPLAVVAVVRRDELREPGLLRALAGLAVAVLATLVTVAKEGTSLNVLVPVEAVLLPLALSGAVLLLRAGASLAARAGAVAAVAFTLAQSASLLASTPTAAPFVHPFASRGAWGQTAPEAEVERQAAAARRCPPGVPFSGHPLIAFVADRPMPAGQPDQYLPFHSTALADVRARVEADVPRCP
jgi:hypothetical protein